MNKKKIIIAVLVIAVAVIVYLYIKKKNSSASTTASSPSVPVVGTSNDPGSSLPALVSVPAPVSQQDLPSITPVVIPSVGATFAPATSSAQINGSGTSSDPLSGKPSGYQNWVNSLGPVNKQKMLSATLTMPDSDINLINKIVTNNMWGDPSVQDAWNDFCRRYSIPIGYSFSNFNAH